MTNTMRKREKKTPPGIFIAQKKRHKARQAVFDAVKDARIYGNAVVKWKRNEYIVLLPETQEFQNGPEIFYVDGNRLKMGIAVPSDSSPTGIQILSGKRQRKSGGRILAVLIPVEHSCCGCSV